MGVIGALYREWRIEIDPAPIDARSLGEEVTSELGLHMAPIRQRVEIELQTTPGREP